MPGKIFVNYRRDDEKAQAARIRDRLANEFGIRNVFMDIDSLVGGIPFDAELETALSRSDVFISIIGPRWLSLLRARAKSGTRDYVREEIAAALRHGILIFPVLIDGTSLPQPDDLPDDIRALVLHQKYEVAHDRFGRDVEHLIDKIYRSRRMRKAVWVKLGQWSPIWQSLAIVLLLVAVLLAYQLVAWPERSRKLMPSVKITRTNVVPPCATPGRLLEYLKSRNSQLDPRFQVVPLEYMALGEKHGLRWDFAFFQMMLETASLSYRIPGRPYEVEPSKNNFAGVTADPIGSVWESFEDIPTGVVAHLENLLILAGDEVDRPVSRAARRRMANRSEGTPSSLNRPVTFEDIAAWWPRSSASYAHLLATIADGFQPYCERSDPLPELIKEARLPRVHHIAVVAPPPLLSGPTLLITGTVPSVAPPQKCDIWAASYGGQRAIIIRSMNDRTPKYTVVSVNEGAEGREARAFIKSYDNRGAVMGDFDERSQALAAAFQYCSKE